MISRSPGSVMFAAAFSNAASKRARCSASCRLARSRWDLLLHGSIVDRFLRDVRNANVQIVPVRAEAAGSDEWPEGESP